MNILTIDLEDWFHILDFPEMESPGAWEKMESRVERNADRLLGLLSDKKQKATWFCLGWIMEKYPSLIKKISADHELGYHSSDHRLLYQSNPKEVRIDLVENIKRLEDMCGKKVSSYRAPGFSFTHETKWMVSVLSEAGIKYDCSIFPAKRNHGGYAAFPTNKPCLVTYNGSVIKEFPMNTASLLGREVVFSGGGYFRLLPYGIITRMMKQSGYVMSYFHPRDFDPGQPVLKNLSARRKFMSYTGLKNSFSKLNRLLNDHNFVTIEEAASQINWNEVPLINLEKF